MTVFTTRRLCIRHITSDDAKDLSLVLSDPQVMRYSTQGVHSQIQISEFIGICGLNKHQVDAESLIHINYRLVQRYQGNGYATET